MKVRLGEIATLITKGTTPTSLGYRFTDKGVNFIKVESISENGNFIHDKFAHISNECDLALKRSQLKENDILFSIAGAIGRTAIVDKEILPANTNQALAIIRLKQDRVFYPYVKYMLQSGNIRAQIEIKKQGVAQLNLSLKDISELEVNLPSIAEQKAIFELFNKVDVIIENRKQQVKKLDLLIKSQFIEMFGTIDESQFVPLSSVGKISTGSTPSMRVKEYYEKKEVPFIKPSDIGLEVSRIYQWESAVDNRAKSVCRMFGKGTVLVTCIGTIGKIGISEIKGTCNQQINFIEPYETIDSDFLAYAIESRKAQLIEMANAPVVPIINKSFFSTFKIPVANTKNQKQFARFVEQTDKSKLKIKQSLEKLETLKKALMQKYFG